MPSAAKSMNGEVVVIWMTAAEYEGLGNVRTDDQDSEAERRDDELGADDAAGQARDRLAYGKVEDESRRQEDGEKNERSDVELAVVDGVDGAGLLGVGCGSHDSLLCVALREGAVSLYVMRFRN